MSRWTSVGAALGRSAKDLRADESVHLWLAIAGITISALLALSAIFWREAFGAYRVWVESPTFNHCFLILPISLYMMWSRRRSLLEAPIAAEPLAAIPLAFLSFAWLIASILAILEAQQFVVMTMLQAVLLGLVGMPAYRRFLAPFLYLYFLVPSGAFLVPILQNFTAHFAVLGLELIGVPVFSNGAVIEIPAGTFAVAEACAGLRFLVATIAFGVFFACETYRSVWRRLIFIALCIVVPIIANGLRVFGLLVAAEWIGDATAALADHVIYGWGFFSVVLLILVFIGRSFSDLYGDEDSEPASQPRSALKAGPIAIAALLFAVAASFFPVVAIFLDRSAAIQPPAVPALSAPWKRVSDDSHWLPVVVGATRTSQDAYSDGDRTVYRFVALYVPQGRTNNLIRSDNRVAEESTWKYNSGATGTLELGGVGFPVNITVIDSGARRLTVWSFYVVDGQIVSNLWKVKWLQLRNYLSGNTCPSAFVAFATGNTEGVIPNDLAARYLAAMQPFLGSFCKEHARK
ncbi:MAG TPA: exosortase A [Rhizomicrobium sp.]|nr:exosortase A [Rhizomicrobium sp.]